MRSRRTTTRAAVFSILVFSIAVTRSITATAQSGGAAGWNDARTRALVEMATRRRAEQLADTGLVDYRAAARGYVTFLAQLGDGFLETPKLVKTDQLALEVYWRAPNQSKQRIIGRRDTTLLPTDIQYHRDHLGIVQNNFPDFIRLGDGDEVRDVPHPLSAVGLRQYDFAITDSVRIRAGNDPINLIEVKIRPKDDRDPRVVGAIYLEPTQAQVVRMAFNFTRAAFKDDHLEDLAIVLENRLIAGRFWLPGRQMIEIRRTGTYLDFPVRGIIRGVWDIDQYEFNLSLPAQAFVGPEIVSASPAELRGYKWQGTIIDSLPPDVQATVDPDIQRIQDEARVLVRARALERVELIRLSARRASDFIRVNRVEGLAVGAGFNLRIAPRLFFAARGRVSNDDDQHGKGFAALRWEQPSGTKLELFGSHDYVDTGDQLERSSVFNSLAAQEFGNDMSDLYNKTEAGTRLLARVRGTDVSITASAEENKRLAVHATPFTGSYLAAPQIDPLRGARLTLGFDRPLRPWRGPGLLHVELKGHVLTTLEPQPLEGMIPSGLLNYRASIGVEHRSSLGTTHFIVRENAAASFGDTVPLQHMVYFGGPVSLPGYGLHEVAGKYGSVTRLEMQVPVPFITIPLGRFGRIPGQARLAPHVSGAVVGGSASCTPVFGGRCPGLTEGFYPSAGVGLITIYDLLRFDVARGFKDGRWTFNIDVSRDFWSIL